MTHQMVERLHPHAEKLRLVLLVGLLLLGGKGAYDTTHHQAGMADLGRNINAVGNVDIDGAVKLASHRLENDELPVNSQDIQPEKWMEDVAHSETATLLPSLLLTAIGLGLPVTETLQRWDAKARR